jgi:protein-S-isoprenylcysteine O-methyltransferase Ste14
MDRENRGRLQYFTSKAVLRLNRGIAAHVYCGNVEEVSLEVLNVVMRVLWYGWVLGEVVIAIVTRTRRSKGGAHDRGTQLILWATIVTSFTAAGFLARPAADIGGSHDALRIVAFALMIAGLVVRIVAIWTLGRAFSANVAIRSEQKLLRSGLYSVVRHPSYLGMEIIFLAAGLWTHNWTSLALMVVPPTAAVLYRIHVEEVALRSAFGSEYAEYAKTTKRLVPGVY